MVVKKKNTAGMAFIVSALKRNSAAQYADIKGRADKKRLTIYPIMYGRAQALLGIVKSAKRGTGKAAMATAGKRGPGRPPKAVRGPGRPRTAPEVNGLSGFVDVIRAQNRERQDLRTALERIQGLAASALE